MTSAREARYETPMTISARPRPARQAATADACPGVLRLHVAADGHLARVRVPAGRLDARALEALAGAASLGSDIVELTSRAGLQVRGLSPDGGEALADILSRGGLLPSLAHDRVRNILAAPLAGRGPMALADVDGVLDELDRALCADAALADLPGRFLFAVDDGTSALDPLRADVELAAERDDVSRSGPSGRHYTFRLYLDGLATSLAVAPAQAPDAALRAAHAFLALRREDADGAWRVRDLRGGARRLAGCLGLHVRGGAGRIGGARAAGLGDAGLEGARRLGISLQRDGRFAVAVLPPLARLGRDQLVRLAELSRSLGVSVRVAPWRTLTFVDVPASTATGLLNKLTDVGLVASRASGWAGLSACAGLGACARALADVRAAAAGRALVRDQTSPTEHWSGCERRCGEPPDAGIRMVARADGVMASVGHE
jgi:sulfite reductase beta subunit-like hemoprotein